MLFGLGLFTEYRRDPERFGAVYDDAVAGRVRTPTSSGRRGLDVTSEAFWEERPSLREQVGYVSLGQGLAPGR